MIYLLLARSCLIRANKIALLARFVKIRATKSCPLKTVEGFDQSGHLLPERPAIGLPLRPGGGKRCEFRAVGVGCDGLPLYIQRYGQVGTVGDDLLRRRDLGKARLGSESTKRLQDPLLVPGGIASIVTTSSSRTASCRFGNEQVGYRSFLFWLEANDESAER